MSYIGQNIKKIRAIRKLSQAAFADLFNLARPSVGAYEEGRSEPKIDTVIAIADHFGLSTDALLRKEMTVNELYSFDILKGEFDPTQMPPALGKSLKVSADPNNKAAPISTEEKVPLIEKDKMLEYIVNLNNRDFIVKQKKIALPVEGKAVVRAFVHGGEEMFFQDRGLMDGAILLGKKAELEVKKGMVGKAVLVVTTKGFITRRLAGLQEKNLLLKADNTAYEDLKINFLDVLEIWEITGVWSKVPGPPSLLENRLMKVENIVLQLERRLNKLDK